MTPLSRKLSWVAAVSLLATGLEVERVEDRAARVGLEGCRQDVALGAVDHQRRFERRP